MSFFVVDVEADGPIPGPYSMVCLGAVRVTESLDETFYGQTRPISDKWDPEALAISGFTRDQHLAFADPAETFAKFAAWIASTNKDGRPILITDNPAYDFAWVNWYFHSFVGNNPFGFSARRIGDLWAGMKGDVRASWKHLRKTVHDHNPVNDAKGNAEALLEMRRQGLGMKL